MLSYWIVRSGVQPELSWAEQKMRNHDEGHIPERDYDLEIKDKKIHREQLEPYFQTVYVCTRHRLKRCKYCLRISRKYLRKRKRTTLYYRRVFDRKRAYHWLRRHRGFFCSLCHRISPSDASNTKQNKYMTVDHIVPIREGGSNNAKNLQLIHWICNNLKTGMSEEESEYKELVALLRSGVDVNDKRVTSIRGTWHRKHETISTLSLWEH